MTSFRNKQSSIISRWYPNANSVKMENLQFSHFDLCEQATANVRAVRADVLLLTFQLIFRLMVQESSPLCDERDGASWYNGRISVNVVMFIDENSKFKIGFLIRLEKGSLIPYDVGSFGNKHLQEPNETPYNFESHEVDPSSYHDHQSIESDGEVRNRQVQHRILVW